MMAAAQMHARVKAPVLNRGLEPWLRLQRTIAAQSRESHPLAKSSASDRAMVIRLIERGGGRESGGGGEESGEDGQGSHGHVDELHDDDLRNLLDGCRDLLVAAVV